MQQVNAARRALAHHRGRRLSALFSRVDLRTVAVNCAVITLVAVVCYSVEIFQVSSVSMEPTLRDGDYVITFAPRGIISRLFDMRWMLRRGAIVVFHAPNTEQDKIPIVFVKRIVAISRDRIRIDNGTLIRNGATVNESYVTYPRDAVRRHDNWPTTTGFIEIRDNHCFVLGDNRLVSTDSRSFGPLPESQVMGIVVCALPHFSRVHAKGLE